MASSIDTGCVPLRMASRDWNHTKRYLVFTPSQPLWHKVIHNVHKADGFRHWHQVCTTEDDIMRLQSHKVTHNVHKADGFCHWHQVCTTEDDIMRLQLHKVIHNVHKANSLLHWRKVCTIEDCITRLQWHKAAHNVHKADGLYKPLAGAHHETAVRQSHTLHWFQRWLKKKRYNFF